MRGTEKAALYLLPAVPLVVDPGGHNHYGPLRWVAAALLVGVVLVGRARAGELRVPSPAGGAWLALLAVTLLSCVVSRDPALTLFGHPVRLGGLTSSLLVFGAFLCGCSAGPRRTEVVARALTGAGGVAAGVAVARFGIAALDGRGGRAIGWSGNAAYLGAFLALALPVTVGVVLASDGRWRRAAAVSGGLIVIALGCTGTRAAWVGAAAGLAVALAFVLPRRARWALPAAVGAVALLALVAPLGTRAPGRLDLSTGTARGRVDTWAAAARAVADRPVLGWGPDGARVALEEHVDAAWVRHYGLEQLPDRAHDVLLDTAVATGGLGLAAWLVLVVAIALSTTRRIREQPVAERALELGLAGGLVAYAVQALFFFETFDTAVVAWLVAGTLVVSGRAVASRLTTVVVATSAVALVAVGVVGVAADRTAASALHRSQPTAVVAGLRSAARIRPRAIDVLLLVAARAGDDARALGDAHGLLAGDHDPDVALADADVLVRLARSAGPVRLREAVQRYDEVLRRQPHNGLAWLGRGEAAVFARDEPGASLALRRANDLLPRSPYPALDLGLLDLARGNAAGACAWARAAGARPGGRAPAHDLRARIVQSAQSAVPGDC